MKPLILILPLVLAAACADNNVPPADPTSARAPDPPMAAASTNSPHDAPANSTTTTSSTTHSTMPNSAQSANAAAPNAQANTGATSQPLVTPIANTAAASNGTPPDNTGINTRDRGGRAVTPMDQGDGADLKTTQRIRQAVMSDSSLSFTAKNVKIVTLGGRVTLRGPVNSDAERGAIGAAAKRIAGDTAVDNQLEVKK